MTNEALPGLAGLVLALFVEYAPWVRAKFAGLSGDGKRLVVVLLSLGLGAALWLVSLQGVGIGEWGQALLDLFVSVLGVLVGSQVVHKVLPKGEA